ncbi:unnamed protein product [Brachionus calyciflorus]|uniref:Uncharacterized protein n=1 Tax=Brachionus calyciflorus TaxID=104777 RepID=A0A814LYL7_9BILA|nr:unnamed protein product [Brachionus calyciflorus]
MKKSDEKILKRKDEKKEPNVRLNVRTFTQHIPHCGGSFLIKQVIEAFEVKNYNKAEFIWLSSIAKINSENNLIDAKGTEYDFFIKHLRALETFKSTKICNECETQKSKMIPDLIFNKINEQIICNLMGNCQVDCENCNGRVLFENSFEEKPLWLFFEMSCKLQIYDFPSELKVN